MNYYFLLFDQFESLDLFGPVEIFGGTPGACMYYISMDGGLVSSVQGAQILTLKAGALPAGSVLLIPGGMGTRSLVKNDVFLGRLAELAGQAAFVLSVCTGSALLAASGILKGKKATSNKSVFAWVKNTGEAEWVRQARWVQDGKYYTASGVSAGIDMALGFVADQYGRDAADEIAKRAEYIWNDDAGCDPFAP